MHLVTADLTHKERASRLEVENIALRKVIVDLRQGGGKSKCKTIESQKKEKRMKGLNEDMLVSLENEKISLKNKLATVTEEILNLKAAIKNNKRPLASIMEEKVDEPLNSNQENISCEPKMSNQGGDIGPSIYQDVINPPGPLSNSKGKKAKRRHSMIPRPRIDSSLIKSRALKKPCDESFVKHLGINKDMENRIALQEVTNRMV